MLSKRMEAVVSMVSPQSFAVADVGCDHAYVSIALIERGMTEKVIAMDVRQGPLEIATGNVKAANLESKIDLRLSDGLEKLTLGEVDTVIIAGMGGLLMKRILEQGRHVLFAEKPPVLILQPQSDMAAVRIFLYNSAYHIVQETMLIEDGKYYTVMRAESGADSMQYIQADWEYGRYNLENRNEVLLEFLIKEQRQMFKIKESICSNLHADGELAEHTEQRLKEVCRKLEDNRSALKQYYDYELQEG